jgi:23S rRNA (guanosine2251-2'-O)-methyltransferase
VNSRIVPGIHSVNEVLKIRPKQIKELWLREGNLNPELQEILNQATSHRTKIVRKNSRALEGHVESHQGVIAFVVGGPAWPEGRDLRFMQGGLFFALDGLEDPHNVGSLLRSAWNLGVKGIISTKDRSAGQPPSAQKVASGAFEHIPFLEVASLSAELLALKDMGFWVYGLDKSDGQPIAETKLAAKCVIVLGSEESGMRKPTIGACDAIVSIPQEAGSESFNAAVAGAIAGYEFVRQNGFPINEKISRKKL